MKKGTLGSMKIIGDGGGEHMSPLPPPPPPSSDGPATDHLLTNPPIYRPSDQRLKRQDSI